MRQERTELMEKMDSLENVDYLVYRGVKVFWDHPEKMVKTEIKVRQEKTAR